MTPTELKEQLDREIKVRNLGLPCISKMKQRDGSHATIVWLIKTREGSYGMLQIVGLTDRPPGVKLRYKLVQEEQLPVSGTDRDLLSKAKALPVTPPPAMPEGSLLTVEQVKEVLAGVTWGEFIEAFANDGSEHEVSWKEAALEGENGTRFEMTFKFGDEKMRLDLGIDPEFQRATPSRLRSVKNPDQIVADAAEFLPIMVIRYAVQSDHPATAPAMAKLQEKALERARQIKAKQTMRSCAVAIITYLQDHGSLPPDLQTLVDSNFLPEATLLTNHETGKMEPPLYHGRPDLRVAALHVTKAILLAAPSADQSGKRVVGFLDSHVEAIDEADYQAQLKAQLKAQ